jgi:hypothetical protein
MQHYVMRQRNLLYTCVTRAKKIFVQVGTKKAISMAVHNNKTSKSSKSSFFGMLFLKRLSDEFDYKWDGIRI